MWFRDLIYSTDNISLIDSRDNRNLYISNLLTARQENVIVEKNIKGIVSIGDYGEDNHQQSSSVAELPIHLEDTPESDFRPLLPKTREFINKIFQEQGSVLVHCVVGVSRSPAIVIAYLIQEYGLTFQQAFDQVKNARPCVCLYDTHMEQLKSMKGQVN